MNKQTYKYLIFLGKAPFYLNYIYDKQTNKQNNIKTVNQWVHNEHFFMGASFCSFLIFIVTYVVQLKTLSMNLCVNVELSNFFGEAPFF